MQFIQSGQHYTKTQDIVYWYIHCTIGLSAVLPWFDDSNASEDMDSFYIEQCFSMLMVYLFFQHMTRPQSYTQGGKMNSITVAIKSANNFLHHIIVVIENLLLK